jgi:membrane-bound serine protease (ClpP class)
MERNLNKVAVLALAFSFALFLCPLWQGHARAASASDAQPAAIVPLVGEIDDYSRNDLIRRFDQAKAMGAKVIIVDINSPGGLVTSSLEISGYLKRQDDVHTIAFVHEKAYSGAAMVSLACQEIWMQPASVLGDCAPIIFNTGGQLQPLPDTERAKQESPVVGDFIDSAHRNGYNVLLAQGMVSLRYPAYVIQDSEGNQLRVVNQQDYQKLTADGKWRLAPGFESVDGPDRLITVHPDQAVRLGLAKGEIASSHALIASRGYTLLADLTPGAGEKIIEFLNNAFVRMILLTIFLQALYIILHAPGHGAAEAVAMVSLGLLLGVPLLTGYAQWWEVVVIFVGLGLCAFEIFVFPGHFVSLILGSLMVVFGLVSTFMGKEPSGLPGWLPSLQATWHGLQNGLLAVIGAFICWILLSLWLRRYLPRIPYFNKLILTTTTGNLAAMPLPGDRLRQDVWPFVGTIGVAATDLLPGGSVEFPYTDMTRPAAVVSTTGFVPLGTKVVVEDIQGSSVRVRAIG